MSYRERIDPRIVVSERLVEACNLEASAAVDKLSAEREVAEQQMKLEVAWARHGNATEYSRHLSALIASASVVERPFVDERGERSEPDLRQRLDQAEGEIAKEREAIAAAEQALAEARERLGVALDKLAEATKARIDAQAEHKRISEAT